ncbi:hypothetical protein [Aliiroseovarius sp. YM-037]|uniref:hypothetical protein n=1 Tax=Aliiroseovarius sp. YM-037 TaxID=3341728 RepID=UPI003A80AC08
MDRILVSCKNRRIAFVTAGATYMYRLTRCKDAPAGVYIADVTRDREANKVRFAIRKKEGEEGDSADRPKVAFSGRWQVKRGQIDPVDLLQEQDTVEIQYGAKIPGAEKTKENRRECLLTKPPQQIVKPNGATIDLADKLPKKKFEVEWDLAEFGLADLNLRVGGSVTAEADWHHTAGTIRDICLSSSEGDGGYTGRAKFDIEGGAKLRLGLEGYIEAGIELLELIDIINVGGQLNLDGSAEVAGKISALAEIAFDPKRPKDGFRLLTNIDLSAVSNMELDISAAAGLDVLGFRIFEADWPGLYEAKRGYAWTGGLTFADSFIPEVDLGSVRRASAAEMMSGAKSGPGGKKSRPRRRKSRGIPMSAIIRSVLGIGDGDLRYNGESCEKALPLSWFKPNFLYQDAVSFDRSVNPGVNPMSVGRTDEPTQVSHDPVTPRWGEQITGPSPVGVTEDNWPENGDWARCFQYVEPAKSGSPRAEASAFRELLRGLGHDVDPIQVDHIRELQFGGADRFDNVWPLDRRANMSAGALHRSQIRAYRTLFGNLNGKYFRIASIGLDPDFDRPALPPKPED